MARIDTPTLQCDRCGYTTQDDNQMAKFNTVTGQWNGYQGTKQKWDLCPSCWNDFKDLFMANLNCGPNV